jgi:hypothetical protein
MEHADFTERDKERLAELQKIADEMSDEALKNSQLGQWMQFLSICGFAALACVFLFPTGRGATNWATYLFLILSFGSLTLLLCILRWKYLIQQRVEQEFLGGHYGDEYKKLSARHDATDPAEIDGT